MKTRVVLPLLLVLPALLSVRALSQEGEEPAGPETDAKALVERLGAPEYETRKQAEEDLLALGEQARAVLEEAATSHPDQHVRYEAGRLLERLGPPAGKKERPLREDEPRFPMEGMEKSLERWFRELEERGLLGGTDWDEMFRLLPGHPGLGGGAVLRGSLDTGREKIEYEQAQDGRVSVKVTGEDGETKVHEAESWEALGKDHPDVWKKVRPMLGGLRIQINERELPLPFGEDDGGDRNRFFPGFGPRLREEWDEILKRLRGLGPDFGFEPRARAPSAVPGGFRLGIWVGEMSEALRSHLGLEEGRGVLVEEVVPGSLASRLGIERHDVVLTVNGATVGSAEDIRAAVASLPEGAAIRVDVIRRGEPLQLHR